MRIYVGGGRAAPRFEYAHRWAWIQAHGPIPEGMVVMHTCDNPPCVRLDHLRLGTKAENNADMRSKDRQRNGLADRTHCKNGHPFDEVNSYHNGRQRVCRACKADWARRDRARGRDLLRGAR